MKGGSGSERAEMGRRVRRESGRAREGWVDVFGDNLKVGWRWYKDVEEEEKEDREEEEECLR